MSVSTSGFALRKNGTCQANEVDCGPTVAPYRSCCPATSFCPSQYNSACCPSLSNCTTILLQDPQCANQTWDLYDNEGYFCCLKGSIGYAELGNSDGCAAVGYSFQNGEVLLSVVSTGQSQISSLPSTSLNPISLSFPPSSPTTASINVNPVQTPSTSPSNASLTTGLNTGTVISSVVGSVAGLALVAALFWIIARKRKRRQSKNSKSLSNVPPAVPWLGAGAEETDGTPLVELTSSHGVSELSGPAIRHELAGWHGVRELR